MTAGISIPVNLLLQLPKGWAWAHAEQHDGENAYAVADARLRALDMTTGSMQGDAPTAAYLDSSYVSKWRGLSERERGRMDACILMCGPRGERTIYVLFRRSPARDVQPINEAK